MSDSPERLIEEAVRQRDAARAEREKAERIRDEARKERERLREALERIRDWDGDEEFLDDVEIELKAIARAALNPERGE